MSKVVTIRLDDHVYNMFKKLALQENRPLSNYIETATLRYIEESGMVDDYEQAALDADEDLKGSVGRALKDYAQERGRFV